MLDPVADLKLNQLEVVDSTKERQHLMQACTFCSYGLETYFVVITHSAMLFVAPGKAIMLCC